MNNPGNERVQVDRITWTQRRAALVRLGVVMGHIGRNEPWPGHGSGLTEEEYGSLDECVRKAWVHSGWATEDDVRHAFHAWSKALAEGAVSTWLERYPTLNEAPQHVRFVGLILAGNVPLVGLHDVLCAWISGHRAVVKCSSQEPELIPALMRVLDHFVPGTAERITFVHGRLGPIDAVIATGSNNTSRYFEYYFGHLPRIVRQSRVSVAVLDGTETEAELTALAEDVFRYFGLGCRNVSKVYLPQDFDLDRLFKAFFHRKGIVDHKKYGNNYDYTRALWMLDRVPFLENGFILFREEKALASPVATLHYQRYTDRSAVEQEIEAQRDAIQCIVGHGRVPFGQAQYPALWDYADGVDTMNFLLSLP